MNHDFEQDIGRYTPDAEPVTLEVPSGRNKLVEELLALAIATKLAIPCLAVLLALLPGSVGAQGPETNDYWQGAIDAHKEAFNKCQSSIVIATDWSCEGGQPHLVTRVTGVGRRRLRDGKCQQREFTEGEVLSGQQREWERENPHYK